MLTLVHPQILMRNLPTTLLFQFPLSTMNLHTLYRKLSLLLVCWSLYYSMQCRNKFYLACLSSDSPEPLYTISFNSEGWGIIHIERYTINYTTSYLW
jgi:hypothetical protein